MATTPNTQSVTTPALQVSDSKARITVTIDSIKEILNPKPRMEVTFVGVWRDFGYQSAVLDALFLGLGFSEDEIDLYNLPYVVNTLLRGEVVGWTQQDLDDDALDLLILETNRLVKEHWQIWTDIPSESHGLPIVYR